MKKIISILFVLLFIPLLVVAQDNPQAMIVFDASGSMWGQVEGKAKITIAKKALNKVVSDWDESVHLGLIAYGHRKKGDCNDIQVLSPIGKINKKGMISKVKKIKPKGKTPISRSIKKAAEALKYTEEKATVILISDGKETCDADPCGTAKALEKEGIDFVAHVIGFDVDKQTDAQLKCIADATGGEYFSAKNASSLNDAMGKIVEKVQKVEAPKPPVVKKLKNNLEISATEKEGGKWVKEAYHEIYKVVDGEKAERYSTYCYSGDENACILQLPAGQYLIATKYNQYKKETPLELDESVLSKVNIVMGQTGKVEITAIEKEGGKWVKEAYHEIYKVVDGEKAERYSTYCYSGDENACLIQLPVGQYLIATKYNKFKQETPLEVVASKLVKKPIIMGQTGKIEITAIEKEGGKWVKEAYHEIFKVVDGEKAERYSTYCYSGDENACLIQLPVGQYLIATKYNKFKQETPLEVVASKLVKKPIIMGQTGKVEITAIEKEGGKWVKEAYHEIFKVVDGEKAERYSTYCYSGSENACLIQLPVGQYLIATKYNQFKKETSLEVVAGDLIKAEIIIGQTGEVEISAVEKKGGKWVKGAYHEIFKMVDGQKEDRHLAYCSSTKKKACVKKLPVGSYLIKTKYNQFKKETQFEIKSGELNKLSIVLGETGEVEISAVEKKGGKWVKGAYHEIFKMVDGQKEDRHIAYCSSTKKKACVKKLPVGSYLIKTKYNQFKKETQFEIKSGELNKLSIVLGETGEVEISAVEKKGGKWVKGAYHEIFKMVDGQKEDRHIAYCSSTKKKACVKKLPVGSYLIKTKYNQFKKETQFEIKSGELSKLSIVLGQTGQLEVSSSEKKGGRWVDSYHEFFKVIDGEKEDRHISYCSSTKKKACLVKLPVGDYQINSRFNKFRKETAIEVKADGINKIHITFGQFFIKAICDDMSAMISHEIYASNGQLIFEKKAKCSDVVKLAIDNGKYSMESKINNDSKESSFTIGSDQPNKITVDMRDSAKKESKEESHEDLIKADTQANMEKPKAQEVAPVKAQPAPAPKQDELASLASDMEEAKKAMTQIGAALGGVKPMQNKPIQTFKESVVVSLPLIKKAKACYQDANDLDQVKGCEAIEADAANKAQEILQKVFGQSAEVDRMEMQSEWNDEIKKATVQKTEDDIHKMELSIICIDKGIGFAGLEKCIANNGKK